jgi:hypothetical protein
MCASAVHHLKTTRVQKKQSWRQSPAGSKNILISPDAVEIPSRTDNCQRVGRITGIRVSENEIDCAGNDDCL